MDWESNNAIVGIIWLSVPLGAIDADAIMGVNFFGEIAPDDFGSYDLAFVTVFTMTAGNSWVFRSILKSACKLQPIYFTRILIV